MRSALFKAIGAVVFLFAAAAAAQINPHQQIRWPSSCYTANMVYSQFIENCINATGTAANPAGGTKQIQYNLGGAFAASTAFLFDPVASVISLGTTIALGDGVIEANLRAFGARASQQTVSCTANGTSSLSSCSTADFQVGDYVFIPQAGVLPSSSVPGSVTAVCGQHNGASCTGSTVYGYQISCIQGLPNGAMTAASTAVTVTQATQTQVSQNSTVTDVYTTVAWPAVTGCSEYAIYKSINGSAYNYYTTIIGLLSFNDHGFMAQTAFGCADIEIPCTAPSSSVRNDVYAQITALSGGNITLGSYTYQPTYASGNTVGGSSFFPSAPSVSGTVTVNHDDTPALVLAWKYFTGLSAATNKALYAPQGKYTFHNASPYGVVGALSINNLFNFTFYGDGDATSFYQYNDRSSITGNFISGTCGSIQSSVGGCLNSGYKGLGGGGTSYTLTDPVNPGATTVTLTTPSNATHLPAGTYVNLFNNSAGAYPRYLYGEVNLVTGSNSTTGVITLAYATNKMYSNSLTGVYGQNAGEFNATPSITPIVGGPVATHLTFRDFAYTGDNTFSTINTCDWCNEFNLTINASEVENGGVNRHHEVAFLRTSEDPYPEGGVAMFSQSAAGSSDYKVHDNTSHINRLMTTGGLQTCTEGSANIEWNNNTIEASGVADNTSGSGLSTLLQMDSGCFDWKGQGNKITVRNADIAEIFYSDPVMSGTTTNNTVHIDTLGSTGSVQGTANVTQTIYHNFYQNSWAFDTIQSGASLIVGSGQQTEAPLTTFPLSQTSGNIGIFTQYTYAGVFTVALTGSVSTINLGSSRVAGLRYAIAFTQPASGGPYTIPSTCGNSGWITGGSGIDCIGGIAPALNPTASSTTTIWFWDDGTTVHEVSRSYLAGGGGVASTAQLPVKITSSITPGAATVSTCTEQTGFTFTGLATSQNAFGLTPPSSLGTHLWVPVNGLRISAANTLAITFCADATGGTPPSGSYTVLAF